MSASIDQVLRVYNVKPKKLKKQRKGKKQVEAGKHGEVKRMYSLERISDPSPDSRKRMKSLEPSIHRKADGRAQSLKCLLEPASLNPSLEVSFERLESLMSKSNQARSSRLNLQMQMLQLEVSELAQGKHLEAIEELEDIRAEEEANQRKGDWMPTDGLAPKRLRAAKEN